MAGLFDGPAPFTLTAQAEGRARLVQAETFSGALIPLTGSSWEGPTRASGPHRSVLEHLIASWARRDAWKVSSS